MRAPITTTFQKEATIETHPTTALLPLLDEEELAALAQDISENGLLQPIALDPQGRILDGRGRLTACERVGVHPTFFTYEQDNADAYVLSVNLRRRNLTKGQTAMITVKARSFEEQDGRSPREQTARSLGEQLGVATAVMGRASTVLQHAPDLVDPVIHGAMGLNEAYAAAKENKAKANSAEVQLAKLREEDPELASRVAEGQLSLAGAWPSAANVWRRTSASAGSPPSSCAKRSLPSRRSVARAPSPSTTPTSHLQGVR
ncbi:ParB N-terminal domain-containing protein [Streptomyces sp. NPDC048219]|uniref:ParB N-terminal domain-containing protein n=1 Tax=Streptomyces sp. NPDC048219 TaxID=3365517 RepID=UPI0037178D69